MKRGVHLPLCTATQSPADDTGQAAQAEGLWGPDPGAGQLATPAAELVTVSSHIGQLVFLGEKNSKAAASGEMLIRETSSPESC